MKRTAWGLALAILGLAAVGVSAQTSPKAEGGENPFAMPELRKYWNPVVGSGAIYEVTAADGKKRTEEYAILSSETVAGKKAYWLEINVESLAFKGKLSGKTLVIPEGFQARKMIVQFPGAAAMEMATGPLPETPKTDASKLLGTETTKVAGGTFECEHWRDADGSETWLSAKVGPMKVVKSIGADMGTRELVKTVSHAKDAISGPVKPFDAEVVRKFAEGQN